MIMAIGLFALGIGGLFGLACLLSAGQSEPEIKKPVDYSGIYKSIQVKEI